MAGLPISVPISALVLLPTRWVIGRSTAWWPGRWPATVAVSDMETRRGRSGRGLDWAMVRALLAKDIAAASRSKAVCASDGDCAALVLLVLLPAGIGLFARNGASPDLSGFLDRVPGTFARELALMPPEQQMIELVLGYLVAPLFLIVPMMISSTLTLAFAGEGTSHARIAPAPSRRGAGALRIEGAVRVPADGVCVVDRIHPVLVHGQRRGVVGDASGVRAHLALVGADRFHGCPAVAASSGLGVVRVGARARTTQGGQPARWHR